MKTTLYYKVVFQRQSILLEKMLDLFLLFASVPRMLLEVFIRKNFGERYFSAFTAIIVFFVLAVIPYRFGYGASFIDVISDNITWYLYLAGFLVACILRGREIQRQPSEFDFARFSLSTGDIDPRFYALRLGGEVPNVRIIETILEPAFFFIIGAVLLLMSQKLGVLLMVSSVLYSLSYIAAYKKGDDFVLDQIDNALISKNFEEAFVNDADSSQTQGFRHYGRKPADPETRRRVAAIFLDDEDEVAVAR